MAAEATTHALPTRAKLVAAFAAVYVIWGSTYLAIRFTLETLPPLFTAGVRFLLAGAALYAFTRLRGGERPRLAHWRSATVVGALLLLCGNGGVVWAEQVVPSGTAALLIATVPFWMVLLAWAAPAGSRPSGAVTAGLVVGFIGLLLLVEPSELMGGGRVDPVGAAVLVVAALAWAAGSIYSRGAELPASPLLLTGMQMIAGGALLAGAGLMRGELVGYDVTTASARSLLAFGYLVVFGSLVGFTCYIWLLRVSRPSLVSTYAYVNPVVAVLLGWAFAGEPLTARVLAATSVIVAAVALITRDSARGGRSRRTDVPPHATPPVRPGRATDATPLAVPD